MASCRLPVAISIQPLSFSNWQPATGSWQLYFMLDNAKILQKIQSQPKRTAGYKQLVRELGIRGNERRELAQRLRAMVRKGELLELERDRYSVPEAAAGKNLFAGRLTMHRDGFGFVQPENEALRQKIDGDIFVPPHTIGNAMHGDRVLVELVSRLDGGRSSGGRGSFAGRGSGGRSSARSGENGSRGASCASSAASTRQSLGSSIMGTAITSSSPWTTRLPTRS